MTDNNTCSRTQRRVLSTTAVSIAAAATFISATSSSSSFITTFANADASTALVAATTTTASSSSSNGGGSSGANNNGRALDPRCPSDFNYAKHCPTTALAQNRIAAMALGASVDSTSCDELGSCAQCLTGEVWGARLAELGLGTSDRAGVRPWVLFRNWLSHEVTSTIAMLLLREAVGYTSTYGVQTSTNEGNIDMICCGGGNGYTDDLMIDFERWGEGSTTGSDNYLDEDDYFTVQFSPTGYTGTSNFFMPAYTLEAYPMANAYNAFKYLPQYTTIFPKAMSTSCANLLAEMTAENIATCGDRDTKYMCDLNKWSSTLCTSGYYVPPQCAGDNVRYCQEIYHSDPTVDSGRFEGIIKNNNLNFTIAYIGKAHYATFLKAKYARKEHFMFIHQSPDALTAALGGRSVNLDPNTAACEALRTEDPTTNMASCGKAAAVIQKAARRDVLRAYPDLKVLMENFQLNDEQISALLVKHTAGGGNLTSYGVACDWAQNNFATWSKWIQHTPKQIAMNMSDSDGVAAYIIVVPIVVAAVLLLLLGVGLFMKFGRANKVDNTHAPKAAPFALIFTDVECSTNLWEACGDEMREAMETHHAIVRRLIAEYQAYEVKTNGDSFMIACKSLTDATLLAMAIQTALTEADFPPIINEMYSQLLGNAVKRGAGGHNALAIGGGSTAGGHAYNNRTSAPTSYHAGTQSYGAAADVSEEGGAATARNNNNNNPQQSVMTIRSFVSNNNSFSAAEDDDRIHSSPSPNAGALPPTISSPNQHNNNNNTRSNAQSLAYSSATVDHTGAGPMPNSNSGGRPTGSLAAMGGGRQQQYMPAPGPAANANTAAMVSRNGTNNGVGTSTVNGSTALTTDNCWHGLRVRMGLHWCNEATPKIDPMSGRYDYFGHDINVCARVESYAVGGQVIVEESTHLHMTRSDELMDLVGPDCTMTLVAKGAVLKGVADKVALWCLVPAALDNRRFPPISAPGIELPNGVAGGADASEVADSADNNSTGSTGHAKSNAQTINPVIAETTAAIRFAYHFINGGFDDGPAASTSTVSDRILWLRTLAQKHSITTNLNNVGRLTKMVQSTVTNQFLTQHGLVSAVGGGGNGGRSNSNKNGGGSGGADSRSKSSLSTTNDPSLYSMLDGQGNPVPNDGGHPAKEVAVIVGVATTQPSSGAGAATTTTGGAAQQQAAGAEGADEELTPVVAF